MMKRNSSSFSRLSWFETVQSLGKDQGLIGAQPLHWTPKCLPLHHTCGVPFSDESNPSVAYCSFGIWMQEHKGNIQIIYTFNKFWAFPVFAVNFVVVFCDCLRGISLVPQSWRCPEMFSFLFFLPCLTSWCFHPMTQCEDKQYKALWKQMFSDRK